MSARARAASAGLAFLVAGCGLLSSEAGTKKASLSDDMAASVFRYQFAHNASALQGNAHVYCIGYGGNPSSEVVYGPSQKLLGLLADVKPHVAAYTACAIDPAKKIIEKSTGGAGLLFKIATVECFSLDRCTIHGGYYEGLLSATSNAYFLKKRHHGWVVVGDKDDWVT